MVEIRCKVCNRLAFKASEDAKGAFETLCNKCGRMFTVTLPLIRNKAVESGACKNSSKESDESAPLDGCHLISPLTN